MLPFHVLLSLWRSTPAHHFMQTRNTAQCNNFSAALARRQENELNAVIFRRHYYAYHDIVQRLSLEGELEGHTGCVNCLQWNERGTLLASGSDDYCAIIWEPFLSRKLCSIPTGHTNNIFSVQFVPYSSDRTLLTGAGDCKIRVHDVVRTECTQVYKCHAQRIKRLAVSPTEANLFWSASEDGTVMQFDLRMPHTCDGICDHVLINLNAHLGSNAEIKCIAVNPCRPELMAVGANDPYVRLYDRRMLKLRKIQFPNYSAERFGVERESSTLSIAVPNEDYDVPTSAVEYYVAGHLPAKYKDYKRKYRPLATTYLTFSPCGSQLLVNLGGEQIYLFDVHSHRQSLLKQIHRLHIPVPEHRNGYATNTSHNGHTSNGYKSGLEGTSVVHETAPSPALASREPLPAKVELLKQQANAQFDKQNYSLAIALYNQALIIAPRAEVLYSNRAVALMKRDWDGDVYAALRDCHTVLQLNPHHLKAHFRLVRCLYELKYTTQALSCLEVFRAKYPEYCSSHAFVTLDKCIRTSQKKRSPSRKRSCSDSSTEKIDGPPTGNSGGAGAGAHVLSDQERACRAMAFDYERRFCGHCNTTTDIKEANFFGSNGQYIVAGSDDGSFFIWEAISGNIVRILKGDSSIVNCLQPHPSCCVLATSGIDPVVRLWSPRPETECRTSQDAHVVTDVDTAASANQRRMNADPLEVMLMNMGYRITGLADPNAPDSDGDQPTVVQCQPS